jgi:2-amino-4-hydroxy-6-hydroxymethyldihydropteridine diphosphokinase
VTISYLGLGSNLGDRLAHLQFAVDGLAARAGMVVAVSAVYETEPMGGPAQPDYLNAVVALDTALDARGLLELAKELEVEAGRNPEGERWGPRPLDIDILMVGDDRVEEADLIVPHPRLHQRGFVLAPLADVAPGVVVAPAAGWRGVRRTPLGLRMSE